jgi:hypothetical protein
MLEAQNFSDLTHRQSLGWHGAPRCCSGERAVGWRLPVVSPATTRVAAFVGISGRLRRNQWPEWIGITGRFPSEYDSQDMGDSPPA